MSKVIDAEVKETVLLEAAELIEITKIPEVQYPNLMQFKAQTLARVQELNIDKIKATPENYTLISQTRTSLNREFKTLEDRRKEVEREFKEPLDKFKADYKEHIANIYTESTGDLTNKLNTIKDEVIKEKEDALKAKFKKLTEEKEIDFLKFEDAKINVQYSYELDKLEKDLEDFIEKVAGELKVIEAQTYPVRVLDEYRRSLDLSQAIIRVTEAVERENKIKEQRRKEQEAAEARKKEIEERAAKAKAEREAQIKQDEEAIAENARKKEEAANEKRRDYMNKVVEYSKELEKVDLSYPEPTPEAKKPVEPEVPKAPTEISITIKVTGTRDQVIALRTYMQKEGIKYE